MNKHSRLAGHLPALTLAALALSMLGWASAAPAQTYDPGLETYKQSALALYTVSLADRNQLSSHAIVLLANDHDRFQIEQITIELDDAPLVSHRYAGADTPPLIAGMAHHHGFFEIPPGTHRIRAQASVRTVKSGYAEAQSIEFDAQINLDKRPRGFSLRLQRQGLRGRPALILNTPLPAADLLAAARLEASNHHPGRALTMLQTLARVDPATSNSPSALLLMGQALRDWGLKFPAEQVFINVERRSSRDDPAYGPARLNAAELALERGAIEAAAKQLFAPDIPLSPALRRRAAALETQVLLARGDLQSAVERAPDSGSSLPEYNTAAGLHIAERGADAELVLARILDRPARDDADFVVRDTALLKLGYRLMERGEAARAYELFGDVTAQGAVVSPAMLGHGWAAIASLARGEPVVTRGLRPAFAHRIDNVMQQAATSDPMALAARNRALKLAVRAWSPLLELDPVDPYVQEGLVALQYAQLLLGDRAGAIEHGQWVIGRLTAISEALSAAAKSASSGQSIALAEIAADAWPPAPGTWVRWLPAPRWWLPADASPPENLHAAHLLQEADVLRLIQSMSGLRDAEIMARAAGADPDLKTRSEELLEQIAEERVRRQQQMDQLTAAWCKARAARARQYLIMARLLLAGAYDRGSGQ